MTDDELFEHMDADFNINITGHVEALNELYRQPHLVQKYTMLFRKEGKVLHRLEARRDRIETILRKAVENSPKFRVYEDDLNGLEDVDFGFDPLQPLDHVPATASAKEAFVKTNKAYMRASVLYKDQKELVEILRNIASFHAGKNRIDVCRIVIDAAKNNMI